MREPYHLVIVNFLQFAFIRSIHKERLQDSQGSIAKGVNIDITQSVATLEDVRAEKCHDL